MLVTDFRPIDDKRYCLYLDYEPFGPVYKSDISRMKLVINEDVPEYVIDEFHKDLYKRAFDKSVSLIKYSERCEYDIRQKLTMLCYDEEIIDKTIAQLEKYRFLDDSRYAGSYIRAHMNRSSRRQMEYQLSKKHIDTTVIANAMCENYVLDEEDVLKKIISRKYDKEALLTKKHYIITSLSAKGFSYAAVKKVVEELT